MQNNLTGMFLRWYALKEIWMLRHQKRGEMPKLYNNLLVHKYRPDLEIIFRKCSLGPFESVQIILICLKTCSQGGKACFP